MFLALSLDVVERSEESDAFQSGAPVTPSRADDAAHLSHHIGMIILPPHKGVKPKLKCVLPEVSHMLSSILCLSISKLAV